MGISIAEDSGAYEHQLTDLVTGEIDKQLRERADMLDAMKSQMAKVLREFEGMTWNVNAKRSWMKSVSKAGSKDIYPTTGTVAIHPIVTAGNIAGSASTSPISRLPKLSAALKGTNRKKHHLQLSSGAGNLPNPQASDDARSPDGKLVFDKKLPRVAHMEKRVDGLQAILAAQQKQQMYEKALVKYPQCRSNVFAPSVYDNNDSVSATSSSSSPADTIGSPSSSSSFLPVPQSQLELGFVYGLQTGVPLSGGSSNGNSVFYLATGEVMWFTAALVVLYTKETNTQRYFREHTNAVTSVGVHPNQYIAASGQAGRQTHLLVWNAKDNPLGKRFTVLTGHTVAVRTISFSHDGKLVASLGGDMYNTICIHDWKEQSLLVTARGHSFRVHTLAFNPFQAYGRPETRRAKKPGQALNDDEACYTLVSCGVRHIRFWTLTKTEYVAPTNEEKENFAFYGSAFGSPARLRPPTPHEKMWKLEGNVPSFHGRLDVQDFTCLAFVDDSPPIYLYDEQRKELVATNQNDHTLGRIIAGTAKGDLCVFYQPRKSPEVDLALLEKQQQLQLQKHSGNGEQQEQIQESEPAKWWEIPDEYTDAEINELVLETIAYEPTARLVDVVPHDHETGNRFKLSKQAQAEIDRIMKRLTLKPNSATLHARLHELKYSGPVAHQEGATQVAFCKKNGLVVSCGGDGKLLLWKCNMQRPVRVPGVSTQGLFTPLLARTFSEGSHQLVPVDQDTRTFQLPSALPGESDRSPNGAGQQPKPTSVQWKDDGKAILVGTSSNCLWELSIASGEWKLVFEARSGAIVACNCHPAKDEVATISQDGYICVWDLRRHRCKRRMHLGSHFATTGGGSGASTNRAVCMEFQPFGDEIAIGMSNGELLIVGYNELRVVLKKTIKAHSSGSSSTVDLHTTATVSASGALGGSSSISQLKYCPKANYLAVGARDTFVYIYDIGDNYKKLHVCEGHSSAITQLTWSAEGDLLQSNASDGELLHWAIAPGKGNMKQITDAFLVRDTQWVKWTCVFGWPTPGIWSEDSTSLVDIAAVCTTGPKAASGSNRGGDGSGDGGGNIFVTGASSMTAAPSPPEGEDLIAVACKSSLRLFKWPAMRAAKSRNYAAHAATILSICFSFNDSYLVSVGGDDATIIQWKCVFGSRSLKTPSPVARKRPQRNSGEEVVGGADDYDTSVSLATSPVPPPATERSNSGQRSPRQHSRQYRERQERGDDDQTEADSEAPGGADTTIDEDSEQVQTPSPSPRNTTLTVLFQARAIHDFQAENPDELSFQKDEILRVLSQESGEWWTGERCDGTRGIFPSDFVEELSSGGDGEQSVDDYDSVVQHSATATAADIDTQDRERASERSEPAALPYRDVNAAVEATATDPVEETTDAER